MRIALDTNVLVAGLLSPFNPPGEIVRMTSAGILHLCYDARILSGYKDVLRRPKFNFSARHVDNLLDQIKECGHSIAAEPLKKSPPDIDNEPFLEVAISGKATCLITGNLKHYPFTSCQGLQILLPTDFLMVYRSQK